MLSFPTEPSDLKLPVARVCPQCGRRFTLPGLEFWLWLWPAFRVNPFLRIICGVCGLGYMRDERLNPPQPK